jgi:nitrile hydratase subunit alpha
MATSDADDRIGYYRRMQSAVEELLILNGTFTREDIDRQVAAMDARTYADGARVVARAWFDAEYRAKLIATPRAACADLGFDLGPLNLIVVENTPTLHNVVVCTLCSCYPRLLLGVPPQWYKSREYRSRVVREPRAVIAELGTTLLADIQVRVHDSTADMRYMVLPMRPAGTDGWSEDDLATLVTRDSLIGVGLPKAAH